ncbi:MAG: Asp-tRNA(Asn)/Glu-tRNA(Gln) amidotransferase subunit GatA [Ignavibacteria bacterium]|nr:Asp-tRNA(Asn)/Glu-tRNA(Gln) amidotransferase subunit GatA [Ignavibacteria bacterium]
MITKKVESYLQTISEKKHLNAFLEIFTDEALQKAHELDKKFQIGEPTGKLAGLIIAVKDNISIKGKRLTCASKILENFISLYNATAVEKLLNEDAIIIGKTNLDEFAMGSSNENSAFGVVKNPFDEERVPGGSSGGSAVAVAANMCDAALGSDTGGSIRQPAAFCGVYGLKPTYGRVSRFGLVAFASSFDCIGPIAKDTETTARILEVISGYDENDSTSSNQPIPKYSELIKETPVKLKFGIPKEFFNEGLDEEIKSKIFDVIEFLKSNSFEVKEISLPYLEYSIADYYLLTTAEASSNLSRYDGVKYGSRVHEPLSIKDLYTKTRDEYFGTEVKRRIMLGTFVLSAGYYDAYYLKAQKVRRLIQNDFIKAFNEIDVIISPTTPTTAFKIGEKTDNPLAMYLSDIYTTSANLAGIPAISIPIGFDSKNLPIGIQFMSNFFREDILLKMSYFIEKKFNSN